MKTKILLAAFVASLIILPWMAFTGDVRDSAAFHSWESSYDEIAHDPWYCRVFGC